MSRLLLPHGEGNDDPAAREFLSTERERRGRSLPTFVRPIISRHCRCVRHRSGVILQTRHRQVDGRIFSHHLRTSYLMTYPP
jgi:hypothetical protein